MTKIALVFTSGLLSICVTVVFMVTGCIFQKQPMDGRCSLANSGNPAVLIPVYQDQTIHFLMSFSGVLIAVTSKQFTNSN